MYKVNFLVMDNLKLTGYWKKTLFSIIKYNYCMIYVSIICINCIDVI